MKDINLEAFWDFSIRFYKFDNTQSLLLNLQDRAATNVNLFLFALYMAKKGLVLEQNELSIFSKAIESLDSLISNLRKKRRALKLKSGTFNTHNMPDNTANKISDDEQKAAYRDLLKQELNYEKQQQQALIACFTRNFEHLLHSHDVIDNLAERLDLVRVNIILHYALDDALSDDAKTLCDLCLSFCQECDE